MEDSKRNGHNFFIHTRLGAYRGGRARQDDAVETAKKLARAAGEDFVVHANAKLGILGPALVVTPEGEVTR